MNKLIEFLLKFCFKIFFKELKSLKEENFNLKLRIYMMEEEMVELNAKLELKECNNKKCGAQLSELDSSALASINSSVDSSSSSLTITENNANKKKRTKKYRIEDFYSTDDEQKDIELENLNRIVYFDFVICCVFCYCCSCR